MKIKLTLAFILVFCQMKAQETEFNLHDNGLIYSESTMGKLKHIVDSLNLKFKVCDANKKYYSNRQTVAHHVLLEGKKAKASMADMDRNISFDAFVKKYPDVETSENLLVMASHYKDYQNDDISYFFDMQLSKNHGNSIQFENKTEAEIIRGNWIYSYNKKNEYSDESVEAYYLLKPFESKELPMKYSRMIQYSDCLIDTTTTVFTYDTKNDGPRYFDGLPAKCQAFNDYVEKALNKPQFDSKKFNALADFRDEEFNPSNKKISKKEKEEKAKKMKILEDEFDAFVAKDSIWESSRRSRMDSLKNNDVAFMPKLLEAYNESKEKKFSNEEFEEYVGLYISKNAALDMKRSRRVIGGCSMDSSPRRHAVSIALLSAETTRWEIFLQSHLNIMNDRFDRSSDGSYAKAARKTYIREIEDLDINVIDLLFGISFRIDNAAENHYFGSIDRLGRALSESRNQTQFEDMALSMIEDNQLDTYNRLVIYLLFRNYNNYLPNEFHQKRNTEKLKTAITKLPDYVYARIDLNK